MTANEVPTIDHPTKRDNFTRVDVHGVTYWFSYRTCVGFDRHDGLGPTVRENTWGPTTGKHLNYIDDGRKVDRVDWETFTDRLNAINGSGSK